MADPEYELRTIPNDDQTQSQVPKTASGSQIPRPLSPRSSITAREPATTRLHYLLWPFTVVIFYAAIALLPWILLCIMSKRPIRGSKDYYQKDTYYDVDDVYHVNEQHFRVALILQSIAGLLTIPITTTICSMACVAYMQSGSLRRTLTLRKAMALADQGWLSPRIWVHIVKVGSLPFYIALGLTVIGSVSQILQNALVTQENILGASYATSVIILDVPDLFDSSGDAQYNDRGPLIYQLRNLLESTTNGDHDVNIWGNTTNPTRRSIYDTFVEPNYEEDPYFAPLPFNFSTGAYPKVQYAPRLNSSLQFTNISENDYKQRCPGNLTSSGSFYARYDYDEVDFWFGLEACMPGDQRLSPWRAVRDRQDITEELYLALNMSENGRSSSFYKATAKSTLGYFELPNTRNGNRPGPLLSKDPRAGGKNETMKRSANEPAANVTYAGNSTLMQASNKGPLTSLAFALFGPGSFIETRMSRPSAFLVPPTSFDGYGQPGADGNCVALRPFDLLGDVTGCVRDFESLEESDVYGSVFGWLTVLLGVTGFSPPAGLLNAGLFLANKLWLGGKSNRVPYPSLRVYYDDGVPTFKPKISNAGIIVGSVLLGMHLLGLLLLALYACVMKPWVERMGSEVMLKMGVVYADVLARAEIKEHFKRAVDELPGFIGDERADEDVGRMRMGAESGLSIREQRKFEVLR